MPRNKTRDAEATREAILRAAERLFAKKGFAGTSLREISEASGASGPLIVFHFKNKRSVHEAVKAAIVKRCVDTSNSNPPTDDSFESFIGHVIRSMFVFYRDNPTMMRLATWGRLEGDIEPWPGEAEWHHIYRERIRLAQERGEIRSDLTPLNISIIICGAVHIWWEYHDHFVEHVLEKNGKGTDADEFYFQQCLAFVLQGLSHADQSKNKKSPSLNNRTKGKSHAKRTAKA